MRIAWPNGEGVGGGVSCATTVGVGSEGWAVADGVAPVGVGVVAGVTEASGVWEGAEVAEAVGLTAAVPVAWDTELGVEDGVTVLVTEVGVPDGVTVVDTAVGVVDEVREVDEGGGVTVLIAETDAVGLDLGACGVAVGVCATVVAGGIVAVASGVAVREVVGAIVRVRKAVGVGVGAASSLAAWPTLAAKMKSATNMARKYLTKSPPPRPTESTIRLSSPILV